MLYYPKKKIIMVTKEISEISSRLYEKIKPKKIYLFGSYARGDYNENSDYDFYLLMPDSEKRDLNDITADAYLALSGIKRKPCDIVVDTESGFSALKERPTLERTVAKEGVLLDA